MSAGQPDPTLGMPPPKQTRQVDRICDVFEAAWFAREKPRIEEFLSDVEPAYREYLLKELLVAEWDLHRQNGNAVEVRTYVERFPDQEDWIVHLHAEWDSDDLSSNHVSRHDPLGNDGDVDASGNSDLSVRCPSCHHLIKLIADSSFSEVTCRVCGDEFSLTDGGSSTHDAASLRKIGHFELIERLGFGAFGTVWKARDTQLDRTVAIKIPRKGLLEPAETDKFLREARAAAQLRHPNIISVHEVGRDGDIVFIVSDLVRGVTLSDWLTGGRMAFTKAAELCAKISDALHHAHEQGVIHRDLKPQNIMLDGHNEPHLMDFGLARRAAGETTMTIEGHVLGTPAYMSPEQARGDAHCADRRADVYSLGVIMFQLLTGELPFRGNARMLIHQVLNAEAPSPRRLNNSVPRDMETICQKCMEKEPAHRYQSARYLAEELRRFLEGEPIQARAISPPARAWRWCKRNPSVSTLAAIAAGLTLFLAIGGPIVAFKQTSLARTANEAAERRRLELYVSDMIAAHQAWSVNNVDRVVELLGKHRPQPEQEDLREFEWYYLWQRCLPSLTTPTLKHDGPVHAIAFLPDGTLVTGTGKRWDLTTEKALGEFDIPDASITDLAVTPDGKFVAMGAYDGVYRLWSLDDLGAKSFLSFGGGPGKNCVAFSCSGTLATEGLSDGNIILWDPQERAELKRLKGKQGGVRSLVFSPDGTKLAAAGTVNNFVWLWDVETGLQTSIGQHGEGNGLATPLAFSPDGKLMAAAGRDKQIRIWDIDSRQEIAVLPGHSKTVSALVFSKNGDTLASCSFDGTVKLWNLGSSEPSEVLKGHSTAVQDIAFSPDGKTLASADLDGKVKLWRLPRPIQRDEIEGREPNYASDGTLASHSSNDGVKVFDASYGQAKPEFRKPGQSYARRSPNGVTIAIGLNDGSIEIWDRESDRKRYVLPSPHQAAIDLLIFSPDGKSLIAAADGRRLKLWDLSSRELRCELDVYRGGNPYFAYAIAFSPDSKRFAAATKEKGGRTISLKLWDLDGLEPVTIEQVTTPIMCVAFSRDDRVATGSNDGSVKIWDVKTSKARLLKLKGHASTVYSLAFSTNGERLVSASADHTVRLWNSFTGDELLSLDHGGRVYSVAFSPDGDTIASASLQRTRLWRRATENDVRSFYSQR